MVSQSDSDVNDGDETEIGLENVDHDSNDDNSGSGGTLIKTPHTSITANGTEPKCYSFHSQNVQGFKRDF